MDFDPTDEQRLVREMARTWSDLRGAEEVVQQLQELHENSGLPILKVSALTGEGAASLVDALEERRTELLSNGSHHARRIDLCRRELTSLLQGGCSRER